MDLPDPKFLFDLADASDLRRIRADQLLEEQRKKSTKADIMAKNLRAWATEIQAWLTISHHPGLASAYEETLRATSLQGDPETETVAAKTRRLQKALDQLQTFRHKMCPHGVGTFSPEYYRDDPYTPSTQASKRVCLLCGLEQHNVPPFPLTIFYSGKSGPESGFSFSDMEEAITKVLASRRPRDLVL